MLRTETIVDDNGISIECTINTDKEGSVLTKAVIIFRKQRLDITNQLTLDSQYLLIDKVHEC